METQMERLEAYARMARRLRVISAELRELDGEVKRSGGGVVPDYTKLHAACEQSLAELAELIQLWMATLARRDAMDRRLIPLFCHCLFAVQPATDEDDLELDIHRSTCPAWERLGEA